MTDDQITELLKARPEGKPAADIRTHTENIQAHFASLVEKLDDSELKQIGDRLLYRIECDKHVPRGERKLYPLSILKYEVLRDVYRSRHPEVYGPCSCEDCSDE